MDDPYIKIYSNAIPDALCDALVTMFEAETSQPHVANMNETYRRCSKLEMPHPNIAETEQLYNELHHILQKFTDKYKNDIGKEGGGPTLNFGTRIEKAFMYCYKPNTEKPEFFHDHADCWNFNTASRQVSYILYLNDVEIGGETVFPFYSLRVKPKKGTILMFPPFFIYTHHADPPLSGNKYVIVTWLHFNGKTHYLTYNL
jgi:prolyl 4-hydroxylase